MAYIKREDRLKEVFEEITSENFLAVKTTKHRCGRVHVNKRISVCTEVRQLETKNKNEISKSKIKVISATRLHHVRYNLRYRPTF